MVEPQGAGREETQTLAEDFQAAIQRLADRFTHLYHLAFNLRQK